MSRKRWADAPWTRGGEEEEEPTKKQERAAADTTAPVWRLRKAEEDAGRQLLLAVRRARRDGLHNHHEDADAARLALRRGAQRGAREDEERADGGEEGVPPPVGWDGGEPGAGPRLVRQRNYAAVDAERGEYGLIDRGVHEVGVRGLVLHKTARGRRGGGARGGPDVRPGTVLRVRSPATGGAGTLRVRFTTPARYYAPGQKVTTLRVGVDASDWQRFVAPRV